MKKITYFLFLSFVVILIVNKDLLVSKYEYNLNSFKYIILALYSTGLLFYFRREKTNLNVLTPDKIFIYLFTFMIFPGILLISSGGISDSIVLFSFLSFLMFISGFWFAKNLFSTKVGNNRFIIWKKVTQAPFESKKLIRIIMFMSLISIFVFILTGNFNRSSALLFFYDLFSDNELNNAPNVAGYRSSVYETGAMGSLKMVIGNYISTLILPLSGAFLFIEGKKRTSNKLKRIGGLLILTTLVFTIGTGSRMMTMRTLLYFFVIVTFLYEVNMKSILRGGFLAFLMLILVTSILGRGEQNETFGGKVSENAVKSFDRIVLTKGSASLLVYDYYPILGNFENGKTFLKDIFGTLSNEKSLANKMYYFITGESGTAGPQTFGEFYANFGFFGQVVLAFFVGMLLCFIILMTYRKKSWSSLDVVVFAYIYLCFGYMGYSSAFSFKSMGAHIVLILYVMLNILSYDKNKIAYRYLNARKY